ncbi:MAG: hypothetical protein A2946_04130 [Candidatus Liptonbacteria bacterium RIFCSPLOWO2_01_FULL_53_13]|uniref:Uncharacterized protein n=1 Tax=Candidatus Liptonbacteria bacterium RIFCSPLOWO2_01_FULL_53_13 TaxID=1798651 RepID=A0A1G2CNA5_9BACT|nr:MAG: hypothetical protein A2946_04130 [Candidatus Liptonbacteria bacterium RIFCSPLOWO2_01_FULL_53_13]
MADHYICTGGCGGVSDKPGVCQAETCAKHGQPLELCGCTDGKHDDVFERGDKELLVESESENAAP